MMIENDEFLEAYSLWSDFKNEVLYKNRFIISHPVLDFVKKISELSIINLNPGKILYRARLMDENDAYNKESSDGFYGFNALNSFVPQNKNTVNDGRANPAYITYLYTAEDEYTAAVEVRPYISSNVSISSILVKEDLRISDLTFDGFVKFNGFESYLFYLIMKDFSKPSNSNTKDYIPTQYIVEYIKSLNFEGIRFNSSLYGRGRNITIFNYDKCEAIASKVYKTNDICYDFVLASPEENEALYHYKLAKYNEMTKEEFKEFLFSMYIKD